MDTAKNGLNIVILDACRNNPFERGFRATAPGLAPLDAPTGTLIAFATAPNKLARDGDGPNSPYTEELVKAMRTPGLRIEDVFKQVRQAVRQRTGNAQIPWEATSLEGEFILARVPSDPAAAAPRPVVREEVRQAVGSLAITTKVAGVEIWLGTEKIGETRAGRALVVDDLGAGAYRLRARKAGHKDWEREVRVTANTRAEIMIDLDPLGPPPTARGDDAAEMVLVPAGEFWRGSTQDDADRVAEECRKAGGTEAACSQVSSAELPRQRVYLDAFYIDRYEVTNAQFERFVRALGHRTSAEREGTGRSYRQVDGRWQWVTTAGATWRTPTGPSSSAPDAHPVVQVSWHDADAYCRWAGKRLPTEAEWEKAARGADGRRWPWGNEWRPGAANVQGDPRHWTAPVGSYSLDVSPYGVYDMAGNAMEWTSSWYAAYPGSTVTRTAFGGDYKVLKGGSWMSPVYPFTHAANRYALMPKWDHPHLGFRCALDTGEKK